MSRLKKAFIVLAVLVVLIFFVSMVRAFFGGPSGEKIGVVEIEGMISEAKETMDNIVKFKEDQSIKGVILRINSPGGAVGPTQEIYREVEKLKGTKKVYVSMGSLCASGGYYIASAGEKLYANPSTITGSIGVIMQLTVVEDLMKKIGIKPNTIKAGSMKDAGTPFREMKEDEREYFNQVVENIHAQFIRDISVGRKMQIENVRKLADGRVYTGLQAKELGLVDSIGNFYDTVDALKTTLNIKGKPVLVYTEKPFSLTRWLFSSSVKEIVDQLVSSPFKYLFIP
jgi:protease IV